MHIRRYKRLGIRTYTPKEEMSMTTEGAISWLGYIGARLAHFNGLIAVFASGILGSMKAFFSAKDKVAEYRRKNEKVLEFRIKKVG